MKSLKFAPRDVFKKILEFGVIPTFDLVIEMPAGGVLLVKRRLAPYQGQWALPGLRMLKPEGIDDTLSRIARLQLGLAVDTQQKRLLGQYVGRFRTEHGRQDLSTAYVVVAEAGEVLLNSEHLSSHRIISRRSDIPKPIGAMYSYYLNRYFSMS